MKQSFFYDLHCHSEASHDSESSLADIIDIAKKRGLTGIAITDHNVFYTGPEEVDGVQIVPGVEITLEDGSHALALFVRSGIPLERPHLSEIVRAVHAQGGIVVLAHICRRGEGWFYHHRDFQEAQHVITIVDAVETWNSKDNLEQHQAALAFLQQHPLLQQRQTAGSDAHIPGAIGYAILETPQRLTAQNAIDILSQSQPRFNKKLEKVQESSERWRKNVILLTKVVGLYYIPGVRHVLYRLWRRWIDFRKTHQQFTLKDEL